MLSAPRHGPSVLSGLVVCGRCGRHMLVGYTNVATAKALRYSCQRAAIDYGAAVCQSLAGAVLESFVVERLLQAVAPAALELSLVQRDCPTQLTAHQRAQIRALSQDLPALWYAKTTTAEDRQTVARLLVEQITVTVEGRTERVEVELRWAGGFSSRHTLCRPVQTYAQLWNYDELVARIEALRSQRKTLTEIAETLHAEGFHPPKRSPRFTKAIVSCFLRERGVRTGSLPRSVTDEQHLRTNEWWLADLAGKLSMPIATLHRWQRVGWVSSPKVAAAGEICG